MVYAAASSGSNPVRMTALQYGTDVEHVIRGVQVTGDTCQLALYEAEETGTAATYTNPTNVTYKSSSAYEFLQGGDYSRLNMMLDHGVTYYEDGSAKDAVQIAADNGYNIVRLRVMNDPGNSDYSPSGYMTKGYVNTEDMLKLALKAKNAGLQILLTIYYSDYWADPLQQYIPHEWSSYSTTELETAVYDFTKDVLTQMQAQGTLPEYVAIGNETNCGLLFGGSNYASLNSNYRNYTQFVTFFNKGAQAVRDISSDIKVLCHFTNITSSLTSLFQYMESADYDIIGLSYYPYWTDLTASSFVTYAEKYATQAGKKVLIMETGYDWNTVDAYGYAGQLVDNGPYDSIYGTSEEAQRNYLQELCNEIKKSDSIIGYLYWDPLTAKITDFTGMTNTLGGSEASNHDNGTVTQNSALFDFTGNRLAAWDAFKYNN